MGYLDMFGYFLIGVLILCDYEILSYVLYVYILLKDWSEILWERKIKKKIFIWIY